MTNYNGGIDLTFPPDLKATLKINNKQGEILTGFDVDLERQKVESSKDDQTYKVKIGEWIIGKINGGGAEITMENYNGDIYIRKAGTE